MIPFFLAAAGGYLVGNSLKSDTQSFGGGGGVTNWGILKFASDNDWRIGKNWVFRNYNDAIGSFEWKYEGKRHEGILYPLDDFSKDFYAHIPLKSGEILFRYKSNDLMGKHLIKINIDKALIYFMEPTSFEYDDKNPSFYSKGIKAEYIVLDWQPFISTYKEDWEKSAFSKY